MVKMGGIQLSEKVCYFHADFKDDIKDLKDDFKIQSDKMHSLDKRLIWVGITSTGSFLTLVTIVLKLFKVV